jgi:2-C-methyl-D-erythritol 4-phosphate cytidylyltransferase
MNIAVIIPAAGASRRYAEGQASPRSKLDEDLGGRPLLHRTVELFNKHPDVSLVVVAGPADDADFAGFRDRHGDKLGLFGVKLCKGGAEHRYETVRNALALVPEACTHVAVHDAARPCASPELIDRIFDAARDGHGAVIPGVDVPDTLKRVDPAPVKAAKPDPLAAILGDDAAAKPVGRAIVETVDRTNLVGVQTPQVFERALLVRAYAQKDLSSTDDAQLVERLGERVLVVPGEASNIKVTRAGDIHLCRAILGVRGPVEREVHKRF